MVNRDDNAAIRRELGIRIRRLRTQQGMSQQMLAEESGVHRAYLATVETGSRNVSANNLIRIAHALNITLSALCEGIDVEMQGRD
ncbi:MAG: helix-turn-helix transcriptional regulator [Coriobacteriales bacterium]|nr:helix-turn-helix transcriptional regulator [Coriobacteriales bacterium]